MGLAAYIGRHSIRNTKNSIDKFPVPVGTITFNRRNDHEILKRRFKYLKLYTNLKLGSCLEGGERKRLNGRSRWQHRHRLIFFERFVGALPQSV